MSRNQSSPRSSPVRLRLLCDVGKNTVFLFALSVGVGTTVAAASLGGALNGAVIEASKVAPALGIHIVDLASQESVFERDADQLRIIASNTKLFTTAAALDTLGPGYFFETNVLMRGSLRESAWIGDLAVLGGGDPNLSGRHFAGDSLAVFRRWAQDLSDRGIERIHGDVYLVNGRFEPPRVHPDWPVDQLDRWYEAPVEALSFNDNCILIRVWPGRAPGDRARIEMIPDLPVLEVRNSAVTVSSSRKHLIAINRINGSDVVTVSGGILRHAAPVESWVTVPDPVVYFGAAVRRAFDDQGVTIAGEIRGVASLPVASWQWATGHRTDLMTTAEVINKRSQNFFAESLIKLLGAELCGRGNWQAGVEVVAEFLGRLGIAEGTFELADGSGMSRRNRFSPRQVTTLLSAMFRHPRGRDFLLTLPYSGEEGLKWESRLAEPPYRGNVFAKTGSLNGVSTLSGYVKARSGKLYAFSILCNKTRSNWQAQHAQDDIVRALIDHG